MNTTVTSPAVDPRIAFFDRLAPQWDNQPEVQARTAERLRELREVLGLRPGIELLEVGCGTGQITGLLAEWVSPGQVTAVDFSPAMLAQARAKGIAAEFCALDICLEAPATAAFNVVLCFQAFPHFRQPVAALKSMARSLKADGRLIILHFAGSAQINLFHQQTGGEIVGDRLPGETEWSGLMAAAGLRLDHCEDRPDLLRVEARLAG